jgi:hypothetical protein
MRELAGLSELAGKYVIFEKSLNGKEHKRRSNLFISIPLGLLTGLRYPWFGGLDNKREIYPVGWLCRGAFG